MRDLIIFGIGCGVEGALSVLAAREFDDWQEGVSFWLIGTFLVAGATVAGLYLGGAL